MYHIGYIAAVSASPTLERQTRPGWSRATRVEFLRTLARTGSAQQAADAVGVPVEAAYALRARVAAFDAGWQAAIATGIARLREVALDRALNGLPKPARGTTADPQFSDTLLLGLLRLYDVGGDRPPRSPAARISRSALLAQLDTVARAPPET